MNSKTKIQQFRIFTVLFIIIFVSACANRMYGVSEEHWLLLDKEERLETIKGYNALAKVRAEKNLLAQKKRYEREKIEREKNALIEEEREHRVDSIYDGYGDHGDLVRMTVQKGKINFNGKHRSYQPVSFKLADGEEKNITFNGAGRYRHLSQNVQVEYKDGIVLFDCRHQYRSSICAQHFAYDPAWRRGKKYPHVFLHDSSRTEARDISITIHLIPVY